jgi:hypothetical protein
MLYPSELQPLDKVYSNLRKPVLHPELPRSTTAYSLFVYGICLRHGQRIDKSQDKSLLDRLSRVELEFSARAPSPLCSTKARLWPRWLLPRLAFPEVP